MPSLLNPGTSSLSSATNPGFNTPQPKKEAQSLAHSNNETRVAECTKGKHEPEADRSVPPSKGIPLVGDAALKKKVASYRDFDSSSRIKCAVTRKVETSAEHISMGATNDKSKVEADQARKYGFNLGEGPKILPAASVSDQGHKFAIRFSEHRRDVKALNVNAKQYPFRFDTGNGPEIPGEAAETGPPLPDIEKAYGKEFPRAAVASPSHVVSQWRGTNSHLASRFDFYQDPAWTKIHSDKNAPEICLDDGTSAQENRTHSLDGDARFTEASFSPLTSERNPIGDSPILEDRRRSSSVREGEGPRRPFAAEIDTVDRISSLPSNEDEDIPPFQAVAVENREQHARRLVMDAARHAPVIDDRLVVPVNDNERNFCTNRHYKLICAAIILALAIISIAVALPVAMRDEPTKPSKPMPTAAPTTGPTTETFAALRELFLPVSGEEVLSDPSTPQRRALEWLANEDAYKNSTIPIEQLTQRYALATFYFATGGDRSWQEQYNFLEPVSECDWYGPGIFMIYDSAISENKGVICNDEGKVDFLWLPENNCSGSLPPEIGELTGMTRMGLLVNHISGTIPSRLYKLTDLQVLWMAYNKFSGTISTEISDMKSLVLLWFHENSLSGRLPDSIGSLENLTVMSLGYNSFSGTIPDSMAALRLEQLGLEYNRFSGNLPDFTSRDLRVMNLFSNSFDGTVPESVCNITSLWSLSLSDNLIAGSIPSCIGDLQELQVLNLMNNDMTGSIPQSIGNIGMVLWGLSLGENSFDGALPDSMRNLTGLGELLLGANELSGTIPPYIGSFIQLTSLQLHRNKFYGTVPTSFKNLTQLDNLLLNGNDLTGDLGFLCNSGISNLFADCGGLSPEIQCPCCTLCCENGEQCDFN